MSIKQIYRTHKLRLQQLDYTCGPVSLLNVLAAKGQTGHGERELAALCKARPDFGTSNADLVKAAEHLGLEILEAADRADISRLEAYLDKNAYVIVCYISLGGGGHYSIVKEHDAQALYLLDCSYGLIRIEKATFLKCWRNKQEPAERWFMAIA